MSFVRQLDLIDQAEPGSIFCPRVPKTTRALEAGGLVSIEKPHPGQDVDYRVVITDNGRNFIRALRRLRPMA